MGALADQARAAMEQWAAAHGECDTQGIMPDEWEQLATAAVMALHHDSRFTHAVCAACYLRLVPGREPVRITAEHRWIATAAYTLTDSEAAAADEGVRTELGVDKLCTFGVGCVDCEQPYSVARTAPCPAGDEWYLPDHPKYVKGAD